MGLKKFIWAVVNVATLGIVQEWFTFAIEWDDGEIEYLRGHTVGQALNQSGYTAETVDDHMVSYCIVNPGEVLPELVNFAIEWDTGAFEYLRGFSIVDALERVGWTAEAADVHIVSYCILKPGEVHPDDPEYH